MNALRRRLAQSIRTALHPKAHADLQLPPSLLSSPAYQICLKVDSKTNSGSQAIAMTVAISCFALICNADDTRKEVKSVGQLGSSVGDSVILQTTRLESEKPNIVSKVYSMVDGIAMKLSGGSSNNQDLTEGRGVCWAIVGLYTGLTLASWVIRKTWPSATLMILRFDCMKIFPQIYGCAGLLTRPLRHINAKYTAYNSVVLLLFLGPTAYECLRTSNRITPTENSEAQIVETSPKWHFVTFWLCSGVWATLGSKKYIHTLMEIANRRHISRTFSAIWESGKGCSGPLFAMLTLITCAKPDTLVNVFMIPFSINISFVTVSAILFECLSVATGRKYWDHAAHIGGAAFGIAWYHFGIPAWDYCLLLSRRWQMHFNQRSKEIQSFIEGVKR